VNRRRVAPWDSRPLGRKGHSACVARFRAWVEPRWVPTITLRHLLTGIEVSGLPTPSPPLGGLCVGRTWCAGVRPGRARRKKKAQPDRRLGVRTELFRPRTGFGDDRPGRACRRRRRDRVCLLR
jgi:hypothetical protein